MNISSLKAFFLKPAFFCVIGLLIFFSAGNAEASRRFTPTVSSSAVVMADTAATVSIQIANTNNGSNYESIYRVRLTFPTATYNASSATVAPTGWSYTIISAGVIEFTTATNPIARGTNRVFNVVLTGPAGASIPAAAVNRTDTLSAAAAWDNAGNTFTLNGNLPTWTRYGLKAQLTASPSSVGVDGTITLTLTVTNRTTGNLNGIVPNAITVTPTGSATLLTGPVPASLNLISGASGNFVYTYQAVTAGSTTFTGSARNGSSSVTSPSVTSDSITITAAQFTVTTVSSDVTMGDGSGIVYFDIANTTGSSGRSIMSIRLNFYDNSHTIYESGAGSSGPPGWNVNVVGPNAPIEYWTTDPTKAIPPGGSLTFKAELTGRPNGENPIASAEADQTDYMANAQAWGGSDLSTNPLTLQGGLPGWQRKGLKTQIFVTPGSLGIGSNLSVQVLITNRSTVQQNGILPGTMLFPPGDGNTGWAEWVSGPLPAALSLASGISGSTLYTYLADTSGTVTFSNTASNGTVSSNPAASNTIEVGSFTAELSIDPVSITSGYIVTVSMLVTNNGSTSLGNVVPSVSVVPGGATANLQTGPAPSSIASLPPGGSGSFLWTYQITGSSGQTYQFQGSAIANGPVTTNTAVSQVGQVVPYYLILSPDTIASGSVPPNLTLNLTVVNGGTRTLNRVWFIVPTGFAIVSCGGPGAPLGDWTCTISGQDVNFTAASAGGAGADIPVGGSATFNIVFSAVPSRPENTQFIFQSILFSPGTSQRGTASDYLLITANKVSLSYTPAGPLPADGSSIYTIDALLTSGGVPLTGKSVSFTATAGTLSSGTAVTNGSGAARVTLTAPVSSVNTQSTVTASYLGSLDNKTLYFNGYTGPNVLYVGGTLSPISARAGNSVSFGLNVMNSGTAVMNLTTGSYFRFTDGTRIYTANLSAAVSVPADGLPVQLTFNSTAVNGSFTLGSYYPTLYLTDGVTPQTRSVSDPVQVIQGLPAGTITLTPVPATITANGSDTSTITSGIIRDANGNQVLNGEYITVATDLGTITTADADPATPLIQVATSGGIITFVLQSGTIAGTANISANNSAYGGTASGSTTVTLTPGPPDGTMTLLPNPGAIPADGASTSTITSDVIKDTYGNTVPDGTFITIATSLGVIISSDMDLVTPGTQASTITGVISFVVQSAIITGIANISADDIAYGGAASGSTAITFFPSGAPQTLQDLKASKSTNDLRLYWTAVTQTVDKNPTSIDHYNIYRGTAPDFVPDRVGHSNRIGTSTNPEYFDGGALLATGNDYYYLVTAVNIWGLESANSNMGFKLNHNLPYYSGYSNNNVISIPYYSPYAQASDLIADIPNGVWVKSLNPNTETYIQCMTPCTRGNFNLEPGKGYIVVVSANSLLVLVGSHNPSTSVTFNYYSGYSNNNAISVPYNGIYGKASDLITDIPNGVWVKSLNPDTETYTQCMYPCTRGNFDLEPGKGYFVVISDDSVWTPKIK